jgi:hypothetical protein
MAKQSAAERRLGLSETKDAGADALGHEARETVAKHAHAIEHD